MIVYPSATAHLISLYRYPDVLPFLLFRTDRSRLLALEFGYLRFQRLDLAIDDRHFYSRSYVWGSAVAVARCVWHGAGDAETGRRTDGSRVPRACMRIPALTVRLTPRALGTPHR